MTINYVTSSEFKEEEGRLINDLAELEDGTPVRDVFEFHFRRVTVKEILEVDLVTMVQAEVVQAYSQLKVPCIVEHAGLIFTDYEKESYPGGLTKPMWNALGAEFLKETAGAGRRAVARAAVAYCDGLSVTTFVGETAGRLAERARGKREFYWDTVFIPDHGEEGCIGKTYAEIVEDDRFGLRFKVLKLSQSTKAMLKLMAELRKRGDGDLWR